MKKNQRALITAVCLGLALGPSWQSAWAASADDFRTAEYQAMGSLDFMHVAAAYAKGYTGKGVVLALLDQPMRQIHPNYAGKTIYSAYHYDDTINWEEILHGSHVSGIMAANKDNLGMHGISYDADLVTMSTNDSDEHNYNYLNSLPISSKVKVVNSSNGIDTYLEHQDLSKYDSGEYLTAYHYISNGLQEYDTGALGEVVTGQAALTQALNSNLEYIRKTEAADRLYVFAASNEGYLSTSLLAGISTFYGLTDKNSILSVLACSSYNGTTHETFNGPASFSNLAMFTENISLMAPGWSIYSTKASTLDATQTLSEDGTSMAAPAVSGVLGLIQQAYPYMSAKQLADVALSTTSVYPVDTSRPTYTLMLSSGNSGGTVNCGINILCYVPTAKPTTQPGWKALIQQATGWSDAKYDTNIKQVNLCDQDGNLNMKRIYFYDNVPMSVIFGQGLVNADLATNGLGSLNAKRLTSSDLDTTYASTANGSQALYKVDTEGYDSVWSNDISETRVLLPGTGANEDTDLASRQAFYRQYAAEAVLHGDPLMQNKPAEVEAYIAKYNAELAANPLLNLHVGLYKSGAGTLALTGTNTYEGSNIVAGGMLEIDGSVAGDAWSVKNSSTGVIGTISGSGTIKGNFYNHGIAQPITAGNLTVNSTLNSDGVLGLVTIADGQSARQIVVGGAANINGSTLQRVTGSSYLPDTSYTFLTAAGGITGSLMNTAGSAFSGLLNVKNLSVSGTSGAVTLGIANNVGSFNVDQQWAYDSLADLVSKVPAGSTQQTQLASLLAASPEAAGAGLASAARTNSPDGAALTMSSLTAMNAIGARTMYLSTTGMVSGGSVNPARSDATVTKESSIIPIDLGPTTSGWLKFSKSWESLGNSDTNGHGFATSFGFDHSVGNSWRLGEFFSYGDNSFAGTNSNLKNKDYRLGIYGIREKGPSQIFLYLDAGRQNNDSKRYITAGTGYLAESSYKSTTIELGGRYTYDVDYGQAQAWHRKPYGEVQVVRYNQAGYNETGAGVWNQSVGSGSSTYSSATVGVGLEKRMKNEEIEVHVGYKRVLSGSDPTYPVHWMDGGTEHIARGSGLDKNLLVVGVHAEQKQEDNWNLSGDIELEQGHSQQNIQASVMLKKSW